jgi:hypothetical protein
MEENQPLRFNDYIFENLPQLIKKVCDVFEEQHEKELMLLSTLCVLSGCLPNVFGVYDNRIYYPNIYVFIVAPPSSGKGNLIYAKRLADKIHKQIKEESSGQSETLFIPANSSSASFVQQLSNNNEKGILFSSEADTLSNALKQDWGNFSDLLRSAFHHEPYSSGRKEGSIELEAPCLTTLVSGTPNQVVTLISDVENGLLSRFVFYRLHTIYKFKDVFNRQKVSYDDHFDSLSDYVLGIYNKLSSGRRIEFKLSEKQKKDFLEFYQSKSVIYRNFGDAFIASYNRMALIQFRIIMILTILREMELGEIKGDIIYCNDVDFKISQELTESLLDHAVEIFLEMPKSNNNKNKSLTGKKLKLFQDLPNEFERKDGLEIAKSLDFSSSTFDRLIHNQDYFISTDTGFYQKKSIK